MLPPLPPPHHTHSRNLIGDGGLFGDGGVEEEFTLPSAPKPRQKSLSPQPAPAPQPSAEGDDAATEESESQVIKHPQESV